MVTPEKTSPRPLFKLNGTTNTKWRIQSLKQQEQIRKNAEQGRKTHTETQFLHKEPTL